MEDFLKAVQHAMRLEGIPEESVDHVINRLVYGDPHGPRTRRASEQSQVGQVIVTMANAPAPEVVQQTGARIRAMSARVRRGELG